MPDLEGFAYIWVSMDLGVRGKSEVVSDNRKRKQAE